MATHLIKIYTENSNNAKQNHENTLQKRLVYPNQTSAQKLKSSTNNHVLFHFFKYHLCIIISMETCQIFFSDYYISREHIHNIFTRNRKPIHLKKTETNIESISIKIIRATLYSSLPSHRKDRKTIKSF